MPTEQIHVIVTPLYRGLDWLEDDIGRSLNDLALEIDEFLGAIRKRFDSATIFALLVEDNSGSTRLVPIDHLQNFERASLFNRDGYLQIAIVSHTLDWNYSLRKASQEIKDEFSAIGDFDNKVIWTFYENGECSDGYMHGKENGDAAEMQTCANRPEHVALLKRFKNISHAASMALNDDQPDTEGLTAFRADSRSEFSTSLFRISVTSAVLALIVLNLDLNILPRKLDSFLGELTLAIFFVSIALSALIYLSGKDAKVRKVADLVVGAIEKLSTRPDKSSRSTDSRHWRLMRRIQWYAMVGVLLTFALLALSSVLLEGRWALNTSNLSYQIFLVSFSTLIFTTLYLVSDPINKLVGKLLNAVLSADTNVSREVNSATPLTFQLEFSKPQGACLIRWLDKNFTIDECKPSIDFIRCDDGSSHLFLQVSAGDLTNHAVGMFAPVENAKPKDTEFREYFLCFRARLTIVTHEKSQQFLRALDASNNQVQVVLKFHSCDGNLLEGCYEEIDSNYTTLLRL